jgi:hypothetical protein
MIVIKGIPVFLRTGIPSQVNAMPTTGIVTKNYFSTKDVQSRISTTYLYSKSVA